MTAEKHVQFPTLSFFVVAGGLLCGLGVAAGSFGAHGLRQVLEATGRADNWETAVRYCLFHGLALLATGAIAASPEAVCARRLLRAAGWCFLLGTVIFSGCLAALALSGMRLLGAVVPVGGGLFLVGWILVITAGARRRT